ncbi:MAG TPA: O-antigen ligase family protein [Thermoanaerobaculia bacterium]|nr:O-antigen ligase family protein [Thermoanaerobaculia bacterium]
MTTDDRGRKEGGSAAGRDRLLLALLLATIAVPPLAVLWGVEGGVAFTLYREPKLAALQVLGWTFVAAFAVLRASRLDPILAGATLRQPFFLAFAGFLAYGGASRLWARVPENHLYEWSQYLQLFVLAALLDLWAREDRRVARWVELGLIGSLGPLVVVGYLQLAGAGPAWLVPIDPGYGVRHASLLGYKNPMALAIAGQLFVLGQATARVLRSRRGFALRLAVASYAAAVVLFLVTLQSRTAVVATAGGALLVAGLHAARHRRFPGGGRGVALMLVLFATVGAVVAASPVLRARFASAGDYLLRPGTLLDSDRGVYLRNTLEMVADRPWGVGLGDWQTWYPVYRRHDRYRAFDETFQARRAHGDHVQVLGELGWPGLLLWWALLAAAGAAPLRRFWREGGLFDLLLVGQLAAFALAMLGDYVVEHPYLKLQLFLVCVLAVARGGGSPASAARRPGRLRRALPAAVLLSLALVHVAWYAGLPARSVAAARLEVSFRDVPSSVAEAAAALDRRRRHGERFVRSWGHAKTFFRAHLVRAHDAALRGERCSALEALRDSLALHPFHPGSFRLCAQVLRPWAPEEAKQCASLHQYVLHEASGGFERPYPAFLLRDGPSCD